MAPQGGHGGHPPNRRQSSHGGADRVGQTVSATAFAEMTGVSRERLRTWERRLRVPAPHAHRLRAAPLRAADVAGVVAVRRAAEDGAPLPRRSPLAEGVTVDSAARARVPRDGRARPGARRAGRRPRAAAAGVGQRGAARVDGGRRPGRLLPTPGHAAGASCCASTSRASCRRPSSSTRVGTGGAGQPADARCSTGCRWSRASARSSPWSGSRRAASTRPARRSPPPRRSWPRCAGAASATTAGSTRSRRWPRSSSASPGRDVIGAALDMLVRQTRAIDVGLATLPQRPPGAARLAARGAARVPR